METKHGTKYRQLHIEDYLREIPAEQGRGTGVYAHEWITGDPGTDTDFWTDKLLDIILRSDNLNAAYKRVKTNRGTGGIDGMQVDELLPYLKEFIRQNPHISISINCQSTNETLDLLDENKIDIGLIGKPDNLKNINFYYLDNIEDIFVANPDYLSNLKKRGITRDSILGNSTLMLLDKHNMTRQYIDDYLQDNHISVAESIDISNMDLLIDFAKIGVGVACVIKSFVTKELQEGSLVEIPLGIPIHKREIGFAYKENLKPSKSLQTFIDFYRTYRPEETL
mgnify:CR=1 FL=1